jgi:uncharacterized protein (TIGR03437 family)
MRDLPPQLAAGPETWLNKTAKRCVKAQARRCAAVADVDAVVSPNVADAVPAIFTADASGRGQGAALNQDSTVTGASNPAAVESVVALYGTAPAI